MIEKVLAIEKRYLGEDHPSTMLSRGVLADIYNKQGMLGEALSLMEGLVSTVERVLGPEHPRMALMLQQLAGLLRTQVRLFKLRLTFDKSGSIISIFVNPLWYWYTAFYSLRQ